MGKLHRIKKAFWQIVSQEPLPVGRHSLARMTSIYIGRRNDGSYYVMDNSYGHAYKGLLTQLIKQYESGDSSSDKSSVKG